MAPVHTGSMLYIHTSMVQQSSVYQTLFFSQCLATRLSTVYMHTIGYDNNVSPYSSNVSTRLYTCTCTGMQMCGHIPAVRTGLSHTCV